MNNQPELDLAVIQLHDVARIVSEKIGDGTLAEEIRKCADRLDLLIKPMKVPANEH